jgi:hopanoid biosynthesis associated RND transporter like protein HpnN
MEDPSDRATSRLALQNLVRPLTRFALKHPALALAGALLMAGACVAYTVQCLQFKTERADLIDPDAEYQQRWLRYTNEFGDALEDLIVVVEGDHADDICRALDHLGAAVEREPELFADVLYRIEAEGLKAKGLQYLSPEDLKKLLHQLRIASMLGGHGGAPDLQQELDGLCRQLQQAQLHAAVPPDLLLQQVSGWMSHVIGTGQPDSAGGAPADPADELAHFSEPRYLLNQSGTMGFLKARPASAAAGFNGPSEAIDRMRSLIADARRAHPQVRIGLTGIPVLESDEMRDTQQSMTWASILSFAGVAALMAWGFRRARYPLLALAMLAIGMAWSFGCATASVGHLNILSMSCAAMLVGLGIDFAIVYLSRYLELRQEGNSLAASLMETSDSVGAGMITAAVTTATTFFAACLTDFAGVAELGLIAGCGILLCTLAAFLTLPAMLVLCDRGAAAQRCLLPLTGRINRLLTGRFPAAVLAVWAVALVACGLGAVRVGYDGNLLNMQADGLESVAWQRRVFENSDSSLLFAVSLADSPQEALELKQKFAALPTVDHVEELASALPSHDMAETAPFIQAIRDEVAGASGELPRPAAINPEAFGRRLEDLDRVLGTWRGQAVERTRAQINRFLDDLDRLTLQEQIALLAQRSLERSGAAARLVELQAMTDTRPVGIRDLPQELASRFISPRGAWLLQVYPKAQIWDGPPLERFVADVRSVDPDVTGTPLQTFEASRAIRRSYQQAGLYSLGAVFLLLLLDFRSLRDSLLAMLPPLCGLLLTFGILGWTGVELNPANMILLPLILGIGVDGGVHVLHDFRRQTGPYRISASMLNALTLTATTSMVGFGCLMIARHRGLFSLGLVLTLGIGSCLLVSTLLLPAVLNLLAGRSRAVPLRVHSAEGVPGDPHVTAAADQHAPLRSQITERSA